MEIIPEEGEKSGKKIECLNFKNEAKSRKLGFSSDWEMRKLQ